MAFDGASIDGSAYLDVVRVAGHAPGRLDGAVSFWSTYGLAVFAVLAGVGWWFARRAGGAAAVTAPAVPVVVVVAYGVDAAVKLLVGEERPCQSLRVKTLEACPAPGDWSFPSNHAAIAAAAAVALFFVSRRLGAAAAVAAVAMAVSRVCDRDHRRTAVIGRSATSPPTSTPAKTSCGWCTPTRGPVDRLRPSAPAGDGLMNRRDAADLAGTRSRRLHGVRHPRMGGDRPERRSSVGRRRFAGLVARPWRGRGDGAGPRGDRYRQSRCPVCPRGAGRHGCRASRAATDVGCRAESCLAGMRAGHALRGDGTRPAAASAARRLGDVGGGWAFPSGHTTTAAPTAGLLIIALSLRVPRGATVLRVVVVCWCVLVGLSRVHLGVHWFSDVIGGWLFATGWLGVSLYGMARWFPSLFVSGSLPTAEDPAEDHAPQDLGRRG